MNTTGCAQKIVAACQFNSANTPIPKQANIAIKIRIIILTPHHCDISHLPQTSSAYLLISSGVKISEFLKLAIVS